MNHFRGKIISPFLSLSVAYIFLVSIIISLYYVGFYQDNAFFSWGPPLTYFGKRIDSWGNFNLILSIVFVHQLINNWVSEVVYPWIINNIQDPKSVRLQYGPRMSLILINLHAVYSQIDLLLLIGGLTSQISFTLIIMLANIITVSIINWKYISQKIGSIPLLS